MAAESPSFPSLLVFGPQSELPSQETLEDLRSELLTNHCLPALRDSVANLPSFWKAIQDSDATLGGVPGDEYLSRISQWLVEGGSLPHRESIAPPNHYGLAVTVLLQIAQYARYLTHLGDDSHRNVLYSLQHEGGVQGFCVGLLSAIAIAGARTEVEIGLTASVALRLAVCIGAYVDLDGGIFSEQPFSCVAVRWREENSSDREELSKIIDSFPEAYISSINDAACVTVTVRSDHLDSFAKEIRERGFRTTVIQVHGRFHSETAHSATASRLTELVSKHEELALPAIDGLELPLRSTVDGQIIRDGSLLQHVLENTVLKPADWHKTLEYSLLQLPPSKKEVAFVGFGSHIPSSIVQEFTLNVLYLSSLRPLRIKQRSSHGVPPLDAGLDHEPFDPLAQYPPHSIAIVGMSGRFPGADSVDELWDLLVEGKVTVEPAPVDRFKLPQTGDYAQTKWWGNFLRDPDAFDHKFFKKSSREAIAWDPQQRILLEVVYEALESAGYFGSSSDVQPDDYGCYIGAVMNNYYDNVSCHPATAYATLGTSRCFLSGCMSHYFGWTGPSLTIDTACSSSLVAINTACRAIWSGECSRAIAGGTNVICSPFDYINLSAAGFLSPTGQCKPFDADADGYCRGEAVGVVVLKRLSDALKENDNILGVIVGSAANQNHNFSHVTVPHSGSQVDLYRKCMKLGGVDPESVSYLEAHGTGTGVGDPVEVRSIKDAFGGPQRDSLLHFGSIKGSIGHTEATAGIAGLIKVLLMMRHGSIPAQASHNSLNPKIPSFSNDHMAIPRSLLPWNPPVRIACVNSYGAAGSNSAVLLREKPSIRTRDTPVSLTKYPLFISAGSSNSLSAYSKRLLAWIRESSHRQGDHDRLASLTFNLADRANRTLPYAITKAVRSMQEVELALEPTASGVGITTTSAAKPVVLVFGGQESDHVGLSEDVYKSSSLFRRHLDSCNDLLISNGLESLYPGIFQTEPMQNVVTLHSALFAVQYASAKSWLDCGLKVDATVGHSFGQLTALCISGVLTLQDALKLVAGRATLMTKHWGPEAGSMVFVQADRPTVEHIIEVLRSQDPSHYVEIACYNGPRSHVVVGSARSVEALEVHVAKTASLGQSVRTKRLSVTNGFHSKFTEPMLDRLTSLSEELEWRIPSIHLETCTEAESRGDLKASDVSEHTRRPVFFQRAVERLVERFPRATWIEAGRGSSVMQLVKGSATNSDDHVFLSPQLTSANAQESLTDVTIELWKSGHAVQYWPFHRSQKQGYGYLSLPPYQFEKTRHWLPFMSRSGETASAGQIADVEAQVTHDILTFVRFTDDGQKEAVFRIDPQADRFQAMLGGHVMSGQTLAPASLYFELVSRAALILQHDTKALEYVPMVEDLVMKSPVGQDTSTEILLTLKRLQDGDPSWAFALTTRPTTSNASHVSEPFEQSTGRVSLKRKKDAQAARDFRRFESLTGYRRYQEVMDNPDAEKMQGNHIYRAFSTVVDYGEAFRGIKQVACINMEAAGRVVIAADPNQPVDQRLVDTPMTDSFMQFAGFLVNYFNNPSMDDVFVCNQIEHIETGGLFNPDAKEWLVYATMSETDGGATADAYIFEAESKRMVMAAFGFHFSRMSRALLGRVLKSVNKSAATNTPAHEAPPAVLGRPKETVPELSTSIAPAKKSSSKRRELLQVLSNVTDITLEDIHDNSTLDDLGIDSLMATEVLNDIRSVLGLTIDLATFLFLEDVKSLAALVDEKLGIGGDDTDSDKSNAPPTPSIDSGVGDLGTPPKVAQAPELVSQATVDVIRPDIQERPTIASAVDAFNDVRLRYDEVANPIGALGFWSDAYPHQARLVLAYVVEAFAKIGCDLHKLRPGDSVPQVRALEKHTKLVRQFYRVLEDGRLIFSPPTGHGFTRTDVPIDTELAESMYHQIVDLHPQHAIVNKLVRAVGSQMAACLVGDVDGLQVVFGNKETKKMLENMYEFWPLLRTPSLLLGDFLIKALTNATGGGKFRILEIGAGTGGTTRYIVNRLRNHGIPFEYVFTDISSSLVGAAKKYFKGADDMSFEVLDIEQAPKPEYRGAFHCIIATNCIHATRNLDVSLRHLSQMLREDGALTLVEITQNMFWLDIVVGLFEGWWLFDDGRSHALVDETHWNQRMRQAGFQEVLWTEGDALESKTVRVIGAFPSKSGASDSGETSHQGQTLVSGSQGLAKKKIKARVETVVYKKVGDQEIHADVYCPGEELHPNQKLPIALMIHGGSHIIFSRKDIRPAQTRLLLEKGFLPVSLDHRLCPETTLSHGPMVDVCDALDWARNTLPTLSLLKRKGLHIDGERVVVVGWSSGGQLAMSLAYTAPARGLRPPEAILAFYCPTDYEDPWWQSPIQPVGAEDTGYQYDVLEAVRDKPVTNHGVIGAWEPLSDPRILADPRCRIVLHINWKAQTLPVIINGLPSRARVDAEGDSRDWMACPQPTVEKIRAVSSRAQIRNGNYHVPTFLIHGTDDDLIPWQQSQGTYEALRESGVESGLALVQGAPHICDLSSNPQSEGWKAAVRGYEFISSFVF